MLFFKKFRSRPTSSKTWEASQSYELEHAIGFMDTPAFGALHAELLAGTRNVSSGYRDETLLREFFGSKAAFDAFIDHITGRECLEIGPCVASDMTGWDVASRRHVIEPLLKGIEEWQVTQLGRSLYESMSRYALPAETLIPELVGRIDGAIVCRNMLDHTPRWLQVLGNIATYATLGCKLLLWTDLDHRGHADEGHYDITKDPEEFKRLVTNIGFAVEREYSNSQRQELNWGCRAVKVR